MKIRPYNLFVSALVALSLALTLAMVSRAQPAETPPEPEVGTQTAAEPMVEPVNEKDVISTTAPAEAVPAVVEIIPQDEPEEAPSAAIIVEAEMRRLDNDTQDGDVSMEKDAESNQLTVVIDTDVDVPEDEEASDINIRVHRRHGSAEEFPLGNHTVPVGSSVRDLVSILGSSVLNGESDGDVVSVLGNTTVNGKASGEAVAVLGSTTINGEVGGEVVAVLGDVILGETAIVHGDVVTIGGVFSRADGAVINGNVQEINILGGQDMTWLTNWVHECLLWGRPLAFGHDLGWAWSIGIGILVAYLLLALLFPRAVEKCTETLEQRPGYSMLAVLLSVLFTPVLLILLAATGVGILLIPFLLAGLFFGSIFGKVVMLAWLGRRITKYFGDGPMNHVAAATLIGGVLILLLYTVPFLGFFLWKVLGVLGLGVVIYTLVLTMKSEKAESQRKAAEAAAATANLRDSEPGVGSDQSTTDSTIIPPTLPVTTLPRAGFWIRIAASALDAVIVGVVVGVINMQDFFLLWYAIYCVVLWAMKGTTVGGIVCGIKVVRLDERKVDWTVAIVRGLGGFLSLAVAGLGFIWVAFDNENQSWHDKIAGTIVVKTPKSGSLI